MDAEYGKCDMCGKETFLSRTYFIIKLQGNHEIFSFVDELQQALYQLNIIFNFHIANIGVFLGKTKKYLQKKNR